MTAAPVPPAAELNCDSVVTTLGDAEPPPVVPPFCDAQPSGLGSDDTNDGILQAETAAVSATRSSSLSSPHPTVTTASERTPNVTIAPRGHSFMPDPRARWLPPAHRKAQRFP